MTQSIRVNGELIRDLRIKKGWSNASDFALALGDKDPQHIRRIERGVSKPSFDLLDDIARLLDVNVALLVVNTKFGDDAKKLADQGVWRLSSGILTVDVPEEITGLIFDIISSYNKHR